MSKKTSKINPAYDSDKAKGALDTFVETLRKLGYDTFYVVYGNSKVERAGAFVDGEHDDIIHMVASMSIAHAPMANIHNDISELVESARRNFRNNPALAPIIMPKDEHGNPLFNSPCDGVDEDDNDTPDEFEHFGFES